MADSCSTGFIGYQKKMVRKPPGGDTHDIFNLEVLQRIQPQDMLDGYKDKSECIKDKDALEKQLEVEDLLPTRICDSHRRSLSDSNLNDVRRTPPLAIGKENMVIYQNLLSPEYNLKGIDAVSDLKLTDDPEEIAQSRNPITGNGLDQDEISRTKLRDATNQLNSETVANEALGYRVQRRPCIRIRQPPGGASSIIF